MSMSQFSITVDAGFLADAMTYDEMVTLIEEVDDYYGDWDFTLKLIGKLMEGLPDEFGMRACGNMVPAFEEWYAKLGDCIRAHLEQENPDV